MENNKLFRIPNGWTVLEKGEQLQYGDRWFHVPSQRSWPVILLPGEVYCLNDTAIELFNTKNKVCIRHIKPQIRRTIYNRKITI